MYGRPYQEPPRMLYWFATTLGALGTILTTVAFVGDLRGGNATATVVHVYSQELYDVAFVTRDGTRCQKPDKWLDPPKRINVSDTFQVHYSSRSPCDHFRRADQPDWWGPYAVPPVFLAIGVVGLLGTRGRRFRRDRDDWFRVRHF
jgi:hypothetical protein